MANDRIALVRDFMLKKGKLVEDVVNKRQDKVLFSSYINKLENTL